MRRFLYYLGLIDLVWTRDFENSEIRLRTVWYDKDGNRFAYGICAPPWFLNQTPVQLLPSGVCIPAVGTENGYVKTWYPYHLKPRRRVQYTWRRP